MKKKLNITIEYDTYNRVRGTIKNMSAFVQRCLENYIANGNEPYFDMKCPNAKTKVQRKAERKQALENTAKSHGMSVEDWTEYACKMANIKWTNTD